MNKIFKSKPKSPQEIVRLIKEALINLEKGDSVKAKEKASEEASKYLAALKSTLCGDNETKPNAIAITQAANEVYSSNLLTILVRNLKNIEFEARKDAVQIFNNLLRRHSEVRQPTVEHILANEQLLFLLIQGYESTEVAGNCGLILRECIRYEPLAKIILNSDKFFAFFDYVENPTFDVASDAFATFETLLLKHKELTSSFLHEKYDKFFKLYERLMDSQNYVLCRQSLRVLSELLLDRTHMDNLLKYIDDAENLKRIMNLLRNKSRNIQFEAFHLFKVFVANPNKSSQIRNILLKNKEKLVEFLQKFQNDRTDDEQFNEEKAVLIKKIEALQPIESSGA
ncbi:calcium-binding protein 39-like [Zophobas morio]|uniref:calcium-binding protein 39-like n=1 Tax=Zophobas morio TaxID=2755281 RepID=UPI00308273D2